MLTSLQSRHIHCSAAIAYAHIVTMYITMALIWAHNPRVYIVHVHDILAGTSCCVHAYNSSLQLKCIHVHLNATTCKKGSWDCIEKCHLLGPKPASLIFHVHLTVPAVLYTYVYVHTRTCTCTSV